MVNDDSYKRPQTFGDRPKHVRQTMDDIACSNIDNEIHNEIEKLHAKLITRDNAGRASRLTWPSAPRCIGDPPVRGSHYALPSVHLPVGPSMCRVHACNSRKKGQ